MQDRSAAGYPTHYFQPILPGFLDIYSLIYLLKVT
jgi:hypothetical protein